MKTRWLIKTWCPGAEVDQVVDTPLNPVIYYQERSLKFLVNASINQFSMTGRNLIRKNKLQNDTDQRSQQNHICFLIAWRFRIIFIVLP
jgi:hypothetical protein